eukprot:5197646-Alexandrium_andersonii.AAC.1
MLQGRVVSSTPRAPNREPAPRAVQTPARAAPPRASLGNVYRPRPDGARARAELQLPSAVANGRHSPAPTP